jgi:hypothetical protein
MHSLVSTIRERYFAWEEGHRKSFYVTQANVPLFRSLAEDYVVEPVGESSCRFTWTIAVAPRTFAKPATPLNRRLLESLFSDTRRHYASR